MALLRNCVRLWVRPSRLFSTEHSTLLDLTSSLNEGGRTTPRMRLMQSDLAVKERLKSNESIGHEGWIKIRKELLAAEQFGINESSVDMSIVHLCLDIGELDKAMEYLQYQWDTNGEMNLSSMISYLRICHAIGPDETQMPYLLKIYDKIREKYTVMDEMMTECCILGISRTKRWKESLELLKTIKLSCNPRSRPYSAIIVAAFDNNEPEIGWKYLREVIVRVNPYHNVYIAYLNYCTRHFEGEKLLEEISKIFELWGDRDIHPYVKVIDEYEKVFKENGWAAVRTSIKEFGECMNCAHKMSSLKITSEQFSKLTQAVRERVLIGKDVYRKSTPKEFDRFIRFMENKKPYDIVIDGLNVSFGFQTNCKPDGTQLMNVVRMCVRMGKRVFVLGRKHMFKWPKLDIDYIRAHGEIFLAENTSADDPFLLYATLLRGPDTQFISKDLMRQHKFLLEDPELTKIFKYWQMAHQLYPIGISTSTGTRVQLKMPPKYLPVAQKDKNGWHVPYTGDKSLNPAIMYEPPQTWICFRRNTIKPTDGAKTS